MTSVSLYRPRTIENALSDFDRYLESFFGESPLTPAGRTLGTGPAVDIRETNDAYMLEAELPGYDEKQIRIHVDGRTLTIESGREEEGRKDSASRKAEKNGEAAKDGDPRFIIRERRINSFSRSFRLPEDADLDAISAGFKNGLLTLEIRKRPEAQKRFIEISRN
ncbi:MAG: Hsp20/alpha crystallin family protein [Spirochaetaceae bacterium]|jgi:HSP20 family protein|nr:Hsp20/alpha crystallin family protein [Spirochaetaceae bacterium]